MKFLCIDAAAFTKHRTLLMNPTHTSLVLRAKLAASAPWIILQGSVKNVGRAVCTSSMN